MQVLGRKGKETAGLLRKVRENHNALTACGSADGVMMPPFFTFSGVKQGRRLTRGTPEAGFNLTYNGWPDEDAWYKFVVRFCEHIVSRGQDKALLVVDGADTHYHLPSLVLLREHNVRLVCLPPACTGKLQPLDVGFFGPLHLIVTGAIDAMANKPGDRTAATQQHLCGLITAAYSHLESKAALECTEPTLAKAFRKSGLCPFNVTVFSEEEFARSDAMLDLSPTSPAFLAAKELRAEVIGLVVDSAEAAACPIVKKKLDAIVKESGYDLGKRALTDDVVRRVAMEKLEAVKASLARAEEKRTVRANNKVAAAELKAGIAARKAAKALAAAQKAAATELALLTAAEAAIAPPAPSTSTCGKRKARPVRVSISPERTKSSKRRIVE